MYPNHIQFFSDYYEGNLMGNPLLNASLAIAIDHRDRYTVLLAIVLISSCHSFQNMSIIVDICIMYMI